MIAATTQDAPKAETTEVKSQEIRSAESPSVPEAVVAAPEATFAEQDHKETVEEKKSTPPVSTHADAMAAIMGLETQVMAVFSPENGNGSWAHGEAEKTEQPMTMAAAAAAQTADSPTRWSAVAVVLAPDEASLSLEQEMQKAYADFAAAESGHAATAVLTAEAPPAVPESSSETPELTASAVIETPVPQAETAIPATPAPEVAQPLSALPEAATEAMSAAVKELEVVAARYEAEQAAAPIEPVSDESLQPDAHESPAAVVAEAPAHFEENVEQKAEPTAELSRENEPESRSTDAEAMPAAESVSSEGSRGVPEVIAPQAETSLEPEKLAATTEVPEPLAADVADQKSKTDSESISSVPASNTSTAGRTDDMSKRESETAAAWASWRRIRETGGPKRTDDSSSEKIPEDRAAMAVAAGAENKPEEIAALDSDPEIASLVDSVLADMRPKIVEEIAKKLGKKK